MITEWCGRPAGGGDRRPYYEKGIHDVVAFHVSMTSSINFPDRDAGAQMEPELFALWSRANAFAGYRYSVEGVEGSGAVAGTVTSLEAKWTNYGSAAATEKWSAGYRLVDRSGAVVRMLPSSIDLKTPSRRATFGRVFGRTGSGLGDRAAAHRPGGAPAGPLHDQRGGGLAAAQAPSVARRRLSADAAGA